MDADRAAAVLGVSPGATASEVRRAFARRARELHPDRPGGDADRFREATEARDALLAVLPMSPAATSPRRILVTDAPRVQGPALISAWTALLALATFLSAFRAAHPLAPAEPLAHWVLLSAVALAFALTGRTPLLVAAALLAGVAAVSTILFTTWGGLVGLLVALPALYGLALAGIARRALRRTLTGLG